jgi:hypothetical protein
MGAGKINQELLKDKSIIRQSLAARVRAFEGRSMKTERNSVRVRISTQHIGAAEILSR